MFFQNMLKISPKKPQNHHLGSSFFQSNLGLMQNFAQEKKHLIYIGEKNLAKDFPKLAIKVQLLFLFFYLIFILKNN